MQRFAIGLLSTLLALVALAAPPQMTSDELLSTCSAADDKNQDICRAFILNIYAAALDARVACDPGEEGIKDARRYVLLYMRENPQDGNASAVDVALDALTQAFPCY